MNGLDQRISPDLADRVEHALHALRQGDTTEFDRLLDEEDASGPGIGELFEGIIAEPEGPTPGVQHMAATRGFRIIREIGRGGMGVVYEAEQEEPRRTVALKVLRRIHPDDFHVKLFRREIQTLARLKHPAIATIHEAGRASEGQHFFTMELVDGQPLNVYVRQRQVPLHERLRLFIGICQAVNYAHQRGVIHRDLKPANIVVGADGNTKILDFGLARITDVDLTVTTMTTETGRILGTLPYMSPEQTRGDPAEIDVRSDVYALGVVLYELLTEQLPYDLRKTRVPAAVRIICEQSPRKPSTIHRVLRGDLETITLKALEKDPARRYQSPLALAEDLERYLTDQPIQARPPSAVYQLQKLVARHKLPCAFVAALFLILMVFGVGMSVLWTRAKEAEEAYRLEAEKTRTQAGHLVAADDDADRAVTFLIQDMLASIRSGDESTVLARRRALDEVSKRAEDLFPEQPRVKAALHEAIGNYYSELGLYVEAESHFRAAVELLRQLANEDPGAYADAISKLGQVQGLKRERDCDEAEALCEQALRIREGLWGSEHPEMARSLRDVGKANECQGDYAAARARYHEALAILDGAGIEYEPELAKTLLDLGAVHAVLGEYEAALSCYEQVLAIVRRGAGDPLTEAQAVSQFGNLLRTMGDLVGAERMLREALAMRREYLPDKNVTVAQSLRNLAALLKEKGDYEEVEGLYGEALAIYRDLLGDDSWQVGGTLIGLGASLTEMGDAQRAESALRDGLAIWEQLGYTDAPLTLEVRGVLGECLTQLGQYQEAEPLVLRGYDAVKGNKGADHPRTLRALRRVIGLYDAWGRPQTAAEYRALLPRDD